MLSSDPYFGDADVGPLEIASANTIHANARVNAHANARSLANTVSIYLII